MKHSIHRVETFEIIGPYTLKVGFEDGTSQTINFEPILRGELLSPLRNPDLFRQVRIDVEVHTLVWPNGADFDPATLHDWPTLANEFIARTHEWEAAEAGVCYTKNL